MACSSAGLASPACPKASTRSQPERDRGLDEIPRHHEEVGWVKARSTARAIAKARARRDPPAVVRHKCYGGSRRERPRQEADGTSGDLTHPTPRRRGDRMKTREAGAASPP